jgi:hypothetical protein
VIRRSVVSVRVRSPAARATEGPDRVRVRVLGARPGPTTSGHRAVAATPPGCHRRPIHSTEVDDLEVGEDDVQLHRRTLLTGGLAAGALLALPGAGALAAPLRTAASAPRGAARTSPMLPGLRLVHADLHNHSHLSDGTGDPELVYTRLREAGLDVAAMTDHTVAARGFGREVCAPVPSAVGSRNPCSELFGMSDAGWRRVRDLASAADTPGRFAALPGFEWSSPYLGHVNVWFSEDWIDTVETGGLTAEGLAAIGLPLELLELQLRAQFGAVLSPQEITDFIGSVRDQDPAGMRRFYDWLLRRPGSGAIGGGADALAGFNHPNREPGVFDDFAYDARVAERLVTLEILNRREDYLFRNVGAGMASPLTACLNAGWRVGLIGVTDEHGTDWGSEEGKGRAGVWLRALDRGRVRDALLDRRVFATREAGLRLAATADGVPMGRTIRASRGPVRFDLDLDLGPDRVGEPVAVQVLRPGTEVPTVVDVIDARSAAPGRGPIRFSVPLDPDDGSWVVLPDDAGGGPTESHERNHCGRRHHASAARGRCPLRTPDPALEPQDAPLHLRRARRHLRHRPPSDRRYIERPTPSPVTWSPRAARCCSWARRSRPARPSSGRRQRVGMPYVTERWMGGMLTNFQTIKGRIARLKELEAMELRHLRAAAEEGGPAAQP